MAVHRARTADALHAGYAARLELKWRLALVHWRRALARVEDQYLGQSALGAIAVSIGSDLGRSQMMPDTRSARTLRALQPTTMRVPDTPMEKALAPRVATCRGVGEGVVEEGAFSALGSKEKVSHKTNRRSSLRPGIPHAQRTIPPCRYLLKCTENGPK